MLLSTSLLLIATYAASSMKIDVRSLKHFFLSLPGHLSCQRRGTRRLCWRRGQRAVTVYPQPLRAQTAGKAPTMVTSSMRATSPMTLRAFGVRISNRASRKRWLFTLRVDDARSSYLTRARCTVSGPRVGITPSKYQNFFMLFVSISGHSSVVVTALES